MFNLHWFFFFLFYPNRLELTRRLKRGEKLLNGNQEFSSQKNSSSSDSDSSSDSSSSSSDSEVENGDNVFPVIPDALEQQPTPHPIVETVSC